MNKKEKLEYGINEKIEKTGKPAKNNSFSTKEPNI